ncbi:metal ABC transporter permease [Williamwhitmania taraxaci]|uniref:Zinc transport system permease protein n=1 Tax=Williamwhitmania taraxaci TaxID=1640674 RepID=A0A1G6JB71_9BACT|nr:metal ABC transporter permease [Williamwhitmania taraxaci]SDC15116.1 zinc transport system permease protein [Williamwhitmania taraxaci]
MIQLFQDIVNFPFLYRAFIAGILLSIAAGIIGTYIVARRLVFLTGGITHASFGGIGIAYFAGINPIFGAFVFSILSAMGIEWTTTKGKLREDSAIGILWSFGMAIGIIFIAITPGYAPNLMGYLFGSIVTVTSLDLITVCIVNLIVLLFFLRFYRWIIYSAFDPEFAKTQRIPVGLINMLMTILVAVTIVSGIRIVGIILLLSLLTIPPSTANLFSRNFKTIAIASVILNMIGITIGLILAYKMNIPSGASVVFVQVILFALAKLTTVILDRFMEKTSLAQKRVQ